MKITEICDILRQELYQNDYQYGFYYDGRKYIPDFSNGFDAEFFNLQKTIYRIQNPRDTMKEKIGTCIDAVMVMKSILDEINVQSKIWLLYHTAKRTPHTILTFEAEEKLVYLELTPQSNKPWYGKEIIYNDERDLIKEFRGKDFVIIEVTEKIIIGDHSDALLRCLPLQHQYMWYTFAYFYLDSAPFGYSFARKALFCLPDERVLFLSYVCLSAQ